MSRCWQVLLMALMALVVTQAAQAQAQAQTQAQAQAPVGQNNAEVRAMLIAVQADQLISARIKRDLSRRPDAADLMQAFIAQMNFGVLTSRLGPVYARFFTREQMVDLAQFFHTDAGRKVLLGLKGQAETGVLSAPLYSALELEEIKRFERSPTGRAYSAAAGKIGPEIDLVLLRWVEDFAAAQWNRVLTVSNKASNALAIELDGGPKAPPVEKIGISYMDDLVRIIVWRFGIQSSVSRDYVRRNDAVDLVPLTKVANLLGAGKIDAARAQIAAAGDILETYNTQMDDVDQQFNAAIDGVHFTGKENYLKGMGPARQRNFDWRVRFGENQRAIFDWHSRFVAFVETRQGTLRYENGKLQLASDADIALYDALARQYNQLAEEAKRLNAERETLFANSAKTQ